MSRKNVSRCTIPTKKCNDSLYVKISNRNEKLSCQFNMNVYDKDSPTKELLPVYEDDQLKHSDILEPGAEKLYKIDVSKVGRKVVFEIIQKNGGSGIKVSRNSKDPSLIELQIK
ncbi:MULTISPECIES: hypothetical protein [unclassified Thermoactinomyces]|uniref:hypothetical protein n=1 Tax=unclassified Thermoactinomyces TaxID=2634588 RepID=UPI0018DC22AF|nr:MULTISPECIES: hypothetical protein [unclassified Thermoactinomyces]MBH8599749.1 hypothetical protein [Thermoactinomyces sp. CICC 10523]MBH8605959.1 hypothetical protein [Thermoactinomyces sp. CICC 10522]